MLCIIGSLANVYEKWETFQLACQDCAGSHASCRHVLILYGPSSVVLLPFTVHYMSFPSYFYWALEQLRPLLTAANSVTCPGCALPAHLSLSARVSRKHGSTVLHRHSRLNHALYFLPPQPSCCQHELTTLPPPPKTYRSISSAHSASAEASPRCLLSPNPHLSPLFFLSAPFSSMINSNRHGPPIIPHHCFAANCLTLSCPSEAKFHFLWREHKTVVTTA